ncbi:MAG TPA: peptidyl-prolyl cis-trans isomerase [Tepidisphaeraceae bacterium]|nr:peptidyl-prolyl cis-trans isomerase [Tepidisphaeraceae bacterium]
MNKRVIAIGCLALLAASCAHEQDDSEIHESFPTTQAATTMPATQPVSRVIARVNGEPITLEELDKPLIAGYGLNVLLNLVQLDLAKQQAARSNVTVTPADIQHEQQMTVDKMFGGNAGPDADSLLDQFLQQQHISRPEFDLVIETNAYLRKLAEPMVSTTITEKDLKLAFAALYGETVKVRDIRLANPREVAEAKRRLASGESFQQVAHEMSRDPNTAQLGGEMPPFSRNSMAVPEVFRQAAFSLSPGQISDTIEADGAYHLIQMVQRIPPKAVKFEDVKDAVRKAVMDQRVQLMMIQLRNQFRQTVLQTLEIDDPVLHEQFIHRVNHQAGEIHGHTEIEKELAREHHQQFPTTFPTTRASAEPPATMPGR